MSTQKERHILSLSGGKDSTALAIYMQGKIPNVEYIFCDTGEELPETYEYLEKLEAFLGQQIFRLNPDRPFTHYLDIYRGVLPDARTRWCTRMLKIKPFEDYVGTDKVVSYIAIRADEEHRKGYISTKPNIEPRYPFIEDGLNKEDVIQILEESGLGIPEYYKWRSRSGCYFCFFQQKIEWVGLLEKHPDLFEKAAAFEKDNPENGERRFTWIERESLYELADPSRVSQIKQNSLAKKANSCETKPQKLLDLFDDDEDDSSCLICHL
ncbi:phosphoadenosine phosphosulfate reductase domain-containing protein [Dethiobacter alkaliphilus]|uniref:Phosphoadenosine phosphosulfate reductase n=1 Tax=Dethiobacter alkaliphilus AHT 1 TaxID=555088 RepID=C0GD37_DETAL|nr:phosphoadenosine phosphosulfate reductase family protein [Dethiobacter alkaliphilus]EEG79122.1 phosphoadenosine phosphosulfate reductase [Dethiobacter alkaliphilus AHT 1]